ncbi:MAG: DegT/DnrJ/EryC1/StrS family aminotransferase [Oscillospiraceae bacterium]|nr:DegT/DnrJ/EryC1/StrS family aminotransferase [Oscillospiraceae bacterium]
MNVPFFDATREYLSYKEKIDQAIFSVVSSGHFILGKQVFNFEEAIKYYTGAKYAIGVSNASDALIIASNILEFKNADVLTPAFSFFSSASCILHSGGNPIFCDVCEDSFCIDISDAEKRITKNTKGIIPVHLFLQTCDMSSCMNLAKKYNLKVLEDSAEALGMHTTVDGTYHHAGNIGDFGVFSFFPTKTLGAYGDGGMIITNNKELYEKAKSYRVHGASSKYRYDYIGYNSRLDAIQAAILKVKISYLDVLIKKRAKCAKQYRTLLSDIEEVELPKVNKGNKEVNYVFCLKVEKKRNDLINYLKNNGVETCVYYPVPMHLQNCFKHLGFKEGDFPVAENLSQKALSLPIFPGLTENEISYVCEKISAFFEK